MFKWLRNLFSPESAEAINAAMHPETTVVLEKAKAEVKEQPKKVAEPKKQPKKAAVKKKASLDLPDFNSMTKLDLDVWARKNLNISVDRRRKKDYIIGQIKKNLKNKES